jgi:hypothetical protein
MSSLEMLEIYKAEAMEQLADTDRYIATLQERITALEYHLGRCRDSAYQMFSATVGVLPMEYVPDAPAEQKKKGKKS